MTARLSDNYDFSDGKPAFITAQLNSPFYIKSDTVFALFLKNNGEVSLPLQSVTFACERFIEGSAIMFVKGKKLPLEATATQKKITLDGIEIPPRESVIIFFRSRSALT